jgi:prepilin-type N-terminal cleavage/methylation domain-containing protein
VRRARRRSLGFTLLEIAVTLAVLAISALVVAPLFGWRPGSDADELEEVVARGRAAAVRRAQPLLLLLDRSGLWRLTTVDGALLLGEGRLAGGPAATITVRYTPLGACVVESAGGTLSGIDAVRCAPRRRSATR